MKRVISLFLSLIILICCFSITASALQPEVLAEGPTRRIKLYNSSRTNHNKTAEEVLRPYVEASRFFDYIKEEIANCSHEVDILEFGIPCTQEIYNAICNSLFYGMPEIFNVSEIGIKYFENGPNAGEMAALCFEYHSFANTVAEYDDCMEKIDLAADKLLKNIEGNKKLTDEQKLLLLHDRLAVWNQYGYPDGTEPIEAHTVYGALVNRTSVCQGYSMAYMYLLNRVGIESYYCSSDTMVHGWNIVYLNGKKYHVDVTWDDIGWSENVNGATGYVVHDNFLRSSKGIYESDHMADDYDTTPTDTKYDNYFWQNSKTEFQLIKDEIYYLDNESKEIKSYEGKDTLCKIEATWKADEHSNWVGNFSCLSSDGRSLLYSVPKAIYKLNLKSNKPEFRAIDKLDIRPNEPEKIYEPSIGQYESIFGFTYQDGELICDINNEPPGGQYSKKYQLRESYDGECKHLNSNEAVKEDEIVANCTQPGSYESVVYCSDCEEEVSRKTITVDALGHSETIKKENEILANCTQAGSYDSVVYCTVCEEELSRNNVIVDALGHTETTRKENEVEATCVQTGSYDLVTYCLECGDVISKENVVLEINNKNHSFGDDDICDLCDYEREPIQIGDANEDGAVNNRDLAIMMQWLNGWPIKAFNEKAADVNGDGYVNNRDYAKLMQRINGWDV